MVRLTDSNIFKLVDNFRPSKRGWSDGEAIKQGIKKASTSSRYLYVQCTFGDVHCLRCVVAALPLRLLPPPEDLPLRRRAPRRVLLRDLPLRGAPRAGGDPGGDGPRAAECGLRHAPPVPRLLRQRLRRVRVARRHADHGRREAGSVQHRLASVLRGGRRGEGGGGEGVSRRRLLRRHRRHRRQRRRRPERRAGVGSEARPGGQPDRQPGGVGRYHAQPQGQRHRPHQPLRPLQPHRRRPGRAFRLPLHRRRPLLLHRLQALQPVRHRQARRRHGPRLPREARRAVSPERRRQRHRRARRHAHGLRQPVLQGSGTAEGVPELRPDALLRRRVGDEGGGGEVQQGSGSFLRCLRRGDDQNGGVAVGAEGRDQAELSGSQRPPTGRRRL